MSEKSNITNILDQYSDRDRLATIGRLFKEGHISEDEYINLLTGDRNYFLTESVQKIQETLSRLIQPTHFYGYNSGAVTSTATPWIANQFPSYTSGTGLTNTSYSPTIT